MTEPITKEELAAPTYEDIKFHLAFVVVRPDKPIAPIVSPKHSIWRCSSTTDSLVDAWTWAVAAPGSLRSVQES